MPINLQTGALNKSSWVPGKIYCIFGLYRHPLTVMYSYHCLIRQTSFRHCRPCIGLLISETEHSASAPVIGIVCSYYTRRQWMLGKESISQDQGMKGMAALCPSFLPGHKACYRLTSTCQGLCQKSKHSVLISTSLLSKSAVQGKVSCGMTSFNCIPILQFIHEGV